MCFIVIIITAFFVRKLQSMARRKMTPLEKLTDVFNEEDEVFVPIPVISYTPQKNESIETTAQNVNRLMNMMELDADIYFKEFTCQVYYGMSARAIARAYNELMDEMQREHAANKHNNKKNNKPQGPKK